MKTMKNKFLLHYQMEHRYTSLILTEKNRSIFTMNGDFSQDLIYGIIIGYFAVRGLGFDDRSFDIIRDDGVKSRVLHPGRVHPETAREPDNRYINKEDTMVSTPHDMYGLLINPSHQNGYLLYTFRSLEFLQGILTMIRYYDLNPEDIIMYMPIMNGISYRIDSAPNLEQVPTLAEREEEENEDSDEDEDSDEE